MNLDNFKLLTMAILGATMLFIGVSKLVTLEQKADNDVRLENLLEEIIENQEEQIDLLEDIRDVSR